MYQTSSFNCTPFFSIQWNGQFSSRHLIFGLECLQLLQWTNNEISSGLKSNGLQIDYIWIYDRTYSYEIENAFLEDFLIFLQQSLFGRFWPIIFCLESGWWNEIMKNEENVGPSLLDTFIYRCGYFGSFPESLKRKWKFAKAFVRILQYSLYRHKLCAVKKPGPARPDPD